jgi:hypothetical protein
VTVHLREASEAQLRRQIAACNHNRHWPRRAGGDDELRQVRGSDRCLDFEDDRLQQLARQVLLKLAFEQCDVGRVLDEGEADQVGVHGDKKLALPGRPAREAANSARRAGVDSLLGLRALAPAEEFERYDAPHPARCSLHPSDA